MAFATSSFPVPLLPATSTAASERMAASIAWNTGCMLGLLPTMLSNLNLSRASILSDTFSCFSLSCILAFSRATAARMENASRKVILKFPGSMATWRHNIIHAAAARYTYQSI